MKVNDSLAIIFIALLFYACNKLNNDKTTTSDIIIENIGKEEEKKLNRTPTDTTTSQTGTQQEKQQPALNIDWDKKIIKTANLSIEVKDFKMYSASLVPIVKRFGGYIASEQQTETPERIENRIKIKVPVQQFQEMMISLGNSGERLSDKQITSEDVTSEVFDTRARVEAKKKIRQRYLNLLEQAKSMEDILKIQAEVNGVQEEIEMAEGRVQYLTHSSAYSTIDVYYYQVLKGVATGTASTFKTKISHAFNAGWEITKELLVLLVTIWPLWIIVAVIVFYYRRKKFLVSIKPSAVH